MKFTIKKSFILLLATILMVSGLNLTLLRNKQTATASTVQGLDATDTSIFGENALTPGLTTDQSSKLIACIAMAVSKGEWLFIPEGEYTINQTIPLYNDIQITGDPAGATILKNTTGTEIGFETPKNQYPNRQNISITNLFMDDIYIYTQLVDQLHIENNVFYHPSSNFVISVNKSNGVTINNNIFLRDQEHIGTDSYWGRTVYIGGYATSSRYQWTENVEINNNIFGVKLDELDAVKSFSQPETIATIDRLQAALSQGQLVLANEQHFIVTGINSYNNLRQTKIEHNLFYSCHDDYGLSVIGQDHAIYLRGSQDIYFANNHLRGWHNGPAGGIKFKSGRNITIVNNYLRNTGMIFYATAEYGLGETLADGKISELSHYLVANNVFDWKQWDEYYSFGVEYHSENVANPDMHDLVFINNEYIHYDNIPANRRIGFTKVMGDGFPPESTYIDNTRNDTPDRFLGVQYWSPENYSKMPADWIPMIGAAAYQYYLEKTAEPMPYQDTLPIAVPQTMELGETLPIEAMVTNVASADEILPTYTADLSELTSPGEYLVPVELTYSTRFTRQVLINVPVTVVDTTAPTIQILQTQFERGKDVTVDQIAIAEDLDTETTLALEKTVDSLTVGAQEVPLIAQDRSGNETRMIVSVEITKSALQLEIEGLFDAQGQLKAQVTPEKISGLEEKAELEINLVLKAEYLQLLAKAKNLLTIVEPVTPSKPAPQPEKKGEEQTTNDIPEPPAIAEQQELKKGGTEVTITLPKTAEEKINWTLIGLLILLLISSIYTYSHEN